MGGQSVIGHIHTIEFQIQGFSEWVEFEAGFIETELPYQLLGQSGFFDNYGSALSGIGAGLRLNRGHSYIGTSGTNTLSDGGTLKKVVSLKPKDSAFCLASRMLSPLATMRSSSQP